MASKEYYCVLGLVFIWFCLLSGHALVSGREVPLDQTANTQNRTSTPFADVSIKYSPLGIVPYSSRPGYGKSDAVDRMYYREMLALDRSLSSSLNNSYSEMAGKVTVPPVDNWALMEASEGDYTNALASISGYGLPTTKTGQITSSSLWFVNGYTEGPERFNTVRAGLHVFPDLYGDNDLHFFTYWAGGGPERKGCYNLLCEGFVQKHDKYVPGNKVEPLSIYNGQQRYLTFRMEREIATGNWLLYVNINNEDALIGYWPLGLFNTLLNDASHIFFGGFVSYGKREASPPMGSGHLASEGQGKAAAIDVKAWKDNSLDAVRGTTDANMPSCYTFVGDSLPYYFGGPGGCITY